MDLTRGIITEYHITVDNSHKRDLSSTEWAYRLLLRLASIIDMCPMCEPYIHALPINPEMSNTPHDDGGLTAILPIHESHIAMHTWPIQLRARLVIDSCKPYPPARVTLHLYETMQCEVTVRSNQYHTWDTK